MRFGDAYRRAAHEAVAAGFDGVALHGGHGYLLDSFLWESTNQRDDRWGGDFARRAAFPAAVVAAVRAEIGDDLPIIFRFSQHKQQDYRARIAQNPEELGTLLRALVDAGVDVLDASARRFHTPAFEGSDLTLAGWAKHLTGARSIAVGSVGIGTTLRESRQVDVGAELDNRTELFTRLAAGEFDLVAIGRLHLAAPDIARIFREGEPLPTFSRTVHESVLT